MSGKRLLRIADNVDIPLDEAVTEKFGYMGRTGSGKTYAAMKAAEEMLDAGVQVVALDPVGKWYGLRLAGEPVGKLSKALDLAPKAYAIPVFGGLHGDLPLNPHGGALLADLIIDRNISAVVDVSQFEHDAEKARFVHDFAARFYFRKKASPGAVHVFVEEAQEFIPQNIQRGEEKMLHVMQRMTRLGRNFGIGMSLITQRPQDVNKKALGMCECVLAFQLTGVPERKAVDAWIREKGMSENLVADLPKLPQGSAFLWSPGWLRVMRQVDIRSKRSADVSATPKVGASKAAGELTPVDLDQLREAMTAVVAEADANDPKKLKARIAELEASIGEVEASLTHGKDAERLWNERDASDRNLREAFAANTAAMLSEAREEAAEDAARFYEGRVETLRVALSEARGRLGAVLASAASITNELASLSSAADSAQAGIDIALEAAAKWNAFTRAPHYPDGGDLAVADAAAVEALFREMRDGELPPPVIDYRDPRGRTKVDATLRGAGLRPVTDVVASGTFRIMDGKAAPVSTNDGALPQRILDALLFFERAGNPAPTRAEVAFFAGVSPKGGHFSRVISGPLKGGGLLVYPGPDSLALTDEGRKRAKAPEIRTLRQMHDLHRARLGSGLKSLIFDAILPHRHDGMTREQLAEFVGASPKGGHFSRSVSSMKSAGLLTYTGKGIIAPAPGLFPKGLR